MNQQVARLSGRLAELEHLGAGYLFQCARSSALGLVPIYALSLQSACTAVMHAAITILFAKDVSVKNLANFTTEEVCKWLEKGVDTTGVGDIRGKVQLFMRRSS